MTNGALPNKQRSESLTASRQRIRDLLDRASVMYHSDPRKSADLVSDALAGAKRRKILWDIALCYARLSSCCCAAQDYVSAQRYAEQGIKACRGIEDSANIRAELYHALGDTHRVGGRWVEAMSALTKARSLAEEGGDLRLVAAAVGVMGDVQRLVGDYPAAITTLTLAIRLAEEAEDRRALAVACNNMAIVYCDMFDWDNGLLMFFRSADMYRAVGNRSGEAIALGNIGLTYRMQGKFEKALEVLRRALEITHDLGLAEHHARFRISAGAVQIYLEQYESGLEDLHAALAWFDSSGGAVQQAMALQALGEAYGRMNMFDEAVGYLNRGLQLLPSGSAPTLEHSICEWLAMIHEERGDTASALDYRKRCANLQRRILNLNNQRTLAMAEAKSEMERVTAQNERFQQQVAQLTDEVEQLEGEIEQKAKELTSMGLRLARKDEAILELKKRMLAAVKSQGIEEGKLLHALLDLIEGNTAEESGWSTFERQFHEVHPGFIRDLSARYPALTPMELRVCSLLTMNLISKDISGILNASFHTVNTHRRNIRAKLGLDERANLSTFLIGFGGNATGKSGGRKQSQKNDES